MIFLFRKEIKKWNAIWWFVIASLALSFAGGSFYLLRHPRKETLKVVSINGEVVTLKRYQQVFGELKSSLDDLALYWGIPLDKLAKMMGMKNLSQSAMERCIQNTLVDKTARDFNIAIGDKSFQKLLASSISRAFIDRSGKLNLAAYQNYLNRLQMSVGDYEQNKEREFKRNMILQFLGQGGHIPHYVRDELTAAKMETKKFKTIKIPFESFLEKVKKEEVDPGKLETFFKEKQESYRVPEKRKVEYWILTPEEYKKKVIVEDELIKRFYERNKSSLYRIPPKVKVRTILFKVDKHASPDLITQVRKNTEEVYKKVTESPEKFAEFAKKYSQDKPEDGGLIDFFKRGSKSPEFERVAFLKLKKPGDISEIVKTERGYEIIKLEDRIPASEKPLASVKDEIVKTLIDRKAIMTLRADLEAVVRTAKSDADIFEKFSDSNNLKKNLSGWITKEDTKGYELANVVAQKAFAARYGYFVHQGKHVLYKMTDKEVSYIPDFENIEESVRVDWQEQKAEKLHGEIAKELKKQAILQKVPFDLLAEQQGFKIINSQFVGPEDEIENLPAKKLFVLTSPQQVLSYKHDSDYYLIKLVESKADGKDGELNDKSEAVRRGRKQRYLDAFVASLQRNARIEINQDIPKNIIT
jgi:parvulin-like peptidyl-prolyl isomerase